MSKKFTIKPPIWPKELTFEEFKKLNPLINENQMIHLYNQYLNKYLTELAEKKIHYKQSLNKQLIDEIKRCKDDWKNILHTECGPAGDLSAGINFMVIETDFVVYPTNSLDPSGDENNLNINNNI